MKVVIDTAGRVVIPKSLREAAGLRPGVPLEARLRDGVIELAPAPLQVDLVQRGHVTVAVSREEVPPLTQEVVNAVLDQIRSERG